MATSLVARSLLLTCLLGAMAGCRAAEIPKVEGPEDETLVEGVTGYVLYQDQENALHLLELPARRDIVLRTQTETTPTLARAAGPDASGRIALVWDYSFGEEDEKHVLETTSVDGTGAKEIFRRPGDTLWDETMGEEIALAPNGGLLAFVGEMTGVQLPAFYVSEGALEIWNLEAEAKVGTNERALDLGLAWSSDGRHLYFVERVARAAVAGEIGMSDGGSDGFGRQFDGWAEIPVVCRYDVASKSKRRLHVGMGPVVSPDSAMVLVDDGDGHWRRVDTVTGSSTPVSLPGAVQLVELVGPDLLLYAGHPTAGAEVGETKHYSPLAGKRELPALKLVRLGTGAFQTVLPAVDLRSAVSFGPGRKAPAAR